MFSLILTCQESYRISGRRIDKNYNFYNEILHHLRRYVKSMHPKTCYLVIEYILPYKTFGCCIILSQDMDIYHKIDMHNFIISNMYR